MAQTRKGSPPADTPGPAVEPTRGEETVPPEESKEPMAPTVPDWPQFLQTATEDEVRARFSSELAALASGDPEIPSLYHVLLLLQPEDSIGPPSLDHIYAALSAYTAGERDVLLILLSRGGLIEPAYQISKLCKAYARRRFVVAVPRQAKSAATLIALGADEIHMGPLAQLGPIDPQLGGLPALGVTRALQTIASLSQQYSGSADMFARYLRMALTVEQIGYCDRVSESAMQYAERLLSTKPQLVSRASQIARELVYEYKDHGFVIDLDEAQRHLGEGWIRTGTKELMFAERIYGLFDYVNLFFGFLQSKRLLAVGGVSKAGIYIISGRQ